MALARLLCATRRYITWNYLGRVLLATTILAITCFTVWATVMRPSEYQTTRSDLEILANSPQRNPSTEILHRDLQIDQRGKITIYIIINNF